MQLSCFISVISWDTFFLKKKKKEVPLTRGKVREHEYFNLLSDKKFYKYTDENKKRF